METNKNKVCFTFDALSQLQLMAKMDTSWKDFGHVLRLRISSKGCGGFEYEIGFSLPSPDDISAEIIAETTAVTIAETTAEIAQECPYEVVMDTFTATYLKRAKVDYQIQTNTHEGYQDGLIVINEDEKLFQGKFWTKQISQ